MKRKTKAPKLNHVKKWSARILKTFAIIFIILFWGVLLANFLTTLYAIFPFENIKMTAWLCAAFITGLIIGLYIKLSKPHINQVTK